MMMDQPQDEDDDDDMAPTPLSQIRARVAAAAAASAARSSPDPRSETPDASFSLSQKMHQFQLQHHTSSPTTESALPKQTPSLQQLQLQRQQQQLAVASSTAIPSSSDYPYLLPSTMMPPSVLASVMAPHTSSTTSTVSRKKKAGAKSSRIEAPQDVLERLLSTRGYGNARRIKADQANYDTMPSPLQLASFGTELVKAIHTSDCDRLSQLLATGLSPNPCNQFRDSIVDLVCKRANAAIFDTLVQHGSDLRVCDGFGRTPLHHCCWASEFCPEIAQAILKVDWKQLLIEDKRGQTPLEYVRADIASDWIEFLEDNANKLFPVGGSVPPVVSMKESRVDGYLPDPPNALPVQLAAAVSSGQMTVEEVNTLSPQMRARFQ